ncbi:MAG TPA: ATP12 family protein [Alphaproteobacteria bacterium]|jgi:chaperone required for assembly of F1-ATPase
MTETDPQNRSDLAAKAAARVAKPATVREAGGLFLLDLGDKPLKTPAGLELALPTRALAEAIAGELAAAAPQAHKNPAAMPNLRFAATALDRVAAARAETVESVVSYGATDLLCYRAEEPADLVARQHLAWQPLLDWMAERFKAVLVSVAGIMPSPQPPKALAALRGAVAAYDDMTLTGLAMATQVSGSLVLGLALVEGRIDGTEIFDLAELDETYQIEKWGEDEEAANRRAIRRRDLTETAAFLRLLHTANA